MIKNITKQFTVTGKFFLYCAPTLGFENTSSFVPVLM